MEQPAENVMADTSTRKDLQLQLTKDVAGAHEELVGPDESFSSFESLIRHHIIFSLINL